MLQSSLMVILELPVKKIVQVNAEIILNTIFWTLASHVILTVPMIIDDFLYFASISSHSCSILHLVD